MILVELVLGAIGMVFLRTRKCPLEVYFTERRSPSPTPEDEMGCTFDQTGGDWEKLEFGYRLALGNKSHRVSKLQLKEIECGSFSLEMQVYPLRGAKNYWRAGIVLMDPMDPASELGLVHIDNHRVFVGIINRQVQQRICQASTFENRWSELAIQVSCPDSEGNCTVYGKTDDNLYEVGEIKLPRGGWRIEIRVWSDDKLDHRVVVGGFRLNRVAD